MDIPRFESHQINPRLAEGDIGDAFQRFVHEVLREEYPELHLFSASGKDGAIDLSATGPTSRLVVECKYIGAEDDAPAAAGKAWRAVAGRLRQHLGDSQGPTLGQSQYEPWYRTDPAICQYIFCTSALFANDARRLRLQDEIETFFTKLAAEHSHLAHLASIHVELVDWNDLSTRLTSRAHLVFRWFPRTRPQGLIPLDEAPEHGSFRAYLSDAKLGYYSRAMHLKLNPVPADVEILDEEAILSGLDDPDLTGLIITGGGGVGKTRLMLELGRLASRNGWTVLRVQSRLKEDAIEQLAERLTPDDRVILLVDYLETQRDFPLMVEKIRDLNDSLSLRLRYIANCRTGYYGTGSLAAASHKKIDLSLSAAEPAAGWTEGFYQQAVWHILENSSIEVTERHIAVCHDSPILAVFLSYLHSTGRRLELAELLKEADFSVWVRRRVQLSFGESVEDPARARSLAMLAAMLPIADSATYHPKVAEHRFLFDRLAADGWIEKLPKDELSDEETWVAAHDVLADQILLSYCSSIPATVEHFVQELLDAAALANCLGSAFLALQRNGDRPPFDSVAWLKVLANAIGSHPTEWRTARDLVMRTSLLDPLQKIKVLGAHAAVWDGAEQETGFQNSLGWLARWAAEQEKRQTSSLDPEVRRTLASFIEKAARCVSSINFLLTSGIRFCPDSVREPALNWVLTRPRQFQTHYLLVAWLEQKLPTGEVADAVQLWASKFRTVSHLSFVARAWLDAGGAKELVEEHIKAWLDEHNSDSEARFVYRAWLDAKGPKKLVEEHIKAWLDERASDVEAGFVYKSWLDAGGAKELVESPIKAWLDEHASDVEARFVYTAWLDAGGAKELVEEHIKVWLEEHNKYIESQFVYKAWLDAGGAKELVEEHIKGWLEEHDSDVEADFVYKAWLDRDGSKDVVREHLRKWLQVHGARPDADFVYKAWLESGGEFEFVRTNAINWLSNNARRLEAVYLSKFLAKQRNLPTDTIKDILTWCQTFPGNEDALWRLIHLGTNLLVGDVAEEVLTTAELLLQPFVSRARIASVEKELITGLLLFLISNAHLGEGKSRARVDTLLVVWLRNPVSFGDGDLPRRSLQRRVYVERVADLVVSDVLTVDTDQHALERFLQWVDNWEPQSKAPLRPTLTLLQSEHPAPGLWDIVELSSDVSEPDSEEI